MASDYDDYDYEEFDDAYDVDTDLENGETASSREILGMSIPEVTILGVLVTIICIFGAFTGVDLLRNLSSSLVTATPSVDPPTLTPSVTPIVKVTPIPDWNRFEFADAQAELWLPSSYQGGDPIAYPEIISMTIDVFVTDEVFSAYAKDLISNTTTAFFAFDTEPSEVWRATSAHREVLTDNVDIQMNEYLSLLFNNTGDRDFRVKNQYITDLYYYSDVGVLIFEEKIILPENVSFFIRYYLFAIRIEDQIWNLIYQIGRAEAPSYQETIFNSADSFFVQP